MTTARVLIGARPIQFRRMHFLRIGPRSIYVSSRSLVALSQSLISISKLELDNPLSIAIQIHFRARIRASISLVGGIIRKRRLKAQIFNEVLLASWTTTIMMLSSMPDTTSTSPVFDEKHIQESSPPSKMHATNPVVSSAEFVLEVSFHDVVER